MKNYAYLVNVDSIANHNKFYEATQNDDMSIDVIYGRVGENKRFHHYRPYEKDFRQLIDSKLSKGYSDVTALHSVVEDTSKCVQDLSYQPIPEPEIQEFVDSLIRASNEFMKANYTVKVHDITRKMVDEAENDLHELELLAANNASLYSFNEKLQEIFTDIPRNMSDVYLYLASSSDDFQRVIHREREMLNNLRGQLMPSLPTVQEHEGTVLDAYGLSVREVSYQQEDEILAHLGKDYGGKDVERRFVKAYVVENSQTRSAFEDFKKEHHLTARDCRLFYHGSKTENWFSIMKQGLLLNPDAKITGKMFGNGLYFASDARKALNYMDTAGSRWNNGRRETGFLAVYAVALGKCYKPSNALGSGFDKNDLPNGCLSVYADKHLTGLQNDEYIVYSQAQCTIKYIMEMSKYMVRDRVYSIDRKALRNQFESGMDTLERTPSGLRAEVRLEKLTQQAVDELYQKGFQKFDIDRLFFDYSINSDRLTFSILDSKGDSMEIKPDFTYDDMTFLLREMKKVFAHSEHDWKALVQKAEQEKVGSIVASKSDFKSHQCHEKPKSHKERD